MILYILHLLVGLTLGLFLPGYILTLILFKELTQIEKISLAVGLSICIDIALGLVLEANRITRFITGGITESNVWCSLGVVSGIFLIIFLFITLSKVKTKKR